MRARAFLLCGLLVAEGALALSCRGENGPGGVGGEGGGTDGGPRPTPPRDAGARAGCDVAEQWGCDAGSLCLPGLLPDGGPGNRCFPGECDPVARDCPEGDKCAYVRQGFARARRCVPEGTVREGGACQGTVTREGDFHDTCQRGLHCTDQPAADGGVDFVCRRFCHADARCAAPQECIEVLRFAGSEELPRVCGMPGPECGLPRQDCGSGLGCYPTSRSGSVCVTAGTHEEGAPCAYSNDCQPGSACVRGEAGRECRRLCRYPSGEPACAQERCEPLQGFTDTGACVP
jgi:hypothetical protein